MSGENHEPTNLNEALKMLRQHGEQAVGEDVEKPEPDESEVQEPAGDEGTAEVPEEDALPDGDDDDTGGSAGQYSDADLQLEQEKLVKSAEQMAIDKVNKQFEEQGWQRFGINDIVVRDEKTGRVRFTNPEDPQHDFNSRAEAQAWLDAYDKYFVSEWQNAVRQEQQSYLQEAMPTLQMIQFVPTYQKMSKTEQEVFDALVAGSEVTDSEGTTIGYSVDLQHAGRQAKALAAKFSAKEAQQIAAQTETAPTGPAVDMPSAGSSTEVEAKAPKNLNEAMKAMRKGAK